jgi:hypothetical protein
MLQAFSSAGGIGQEASREGKLLVLMTLLPLLPLPLVRLVRNRGGAEACCSEAEACCSEAEACWTPRIGNIRLV